MKKKYSIKKRKMHIMLRKLIRRCGCYILEGLIVGVMAIGVLVLYCRMAGPLM